MYEDALICADSMLLVDNCPLHRLLTSAFCSCAGVQLIMALHSVVLHMYIQRSERAVSCQLCS